MKNELKVRWIGLKCCCSRFINIIFWDAFSIKCLFKHIAVRLLKVIFYTNCAIKVVQLHLNFPAQNAVAYKIWKLWFIKNHGFEIGGTKFRERKAFLYVLCTSSGKRQLRPWHKIFLALKSFLLSVQRQGLVGLAQSRFHLVAFLQTHDVFSFRCLAVIRK